MRISRRNFNETIAAEIALLIVTPQIVWADALEAWLLEPISGEGALRKPSEVGMLNDSDFAPLQTLYRYIGQTWQLRLNSLGEPDLRSFFDAKTTEFPSYYTEYAEASAVLRRATNELDETDAAAMVLAPRPGSEDFALTRLGRMQAWVCREMITWYVTQGGFQRFGYVNYRGYRKGPFTDPNNLPIGATNGCDVREVGGNRRLGCGRGGHSKRPSRPERRRTRTDAGGGRPFRDEKL